jgi:hypothetical protein
MTKQREPTYLIAAGLALVLVLFAAAAFAAARHFGGMFSERSTWPSTPGAVVTNAVVESTRYNTKRSVYEPVIHRDFQYTYTVAGHQYTGSEYGVHDEGGIDMDARYPVGTEMRVFYDPANPAQAALVVGYSVSPTPFYALGAGALALSLPFAFLSLRMAQGRRRPA